MKTNTTAAFLTMLLVVIYPLVYGIETDGFRDMARFIPENALIYFEQREGTKVLKELTKSQFGKKIETINFIKTGKEIGLPDTALSSLEDVLAFYAFIKENKLVHEVFGKRFAVALLPPIDTQKPANLTDYIQKNTVLVAKPKHSAEGLQFLSESYGRYVQSYSVSSAQYGNHHIKRVQINEQTVSLVIIEGSFVMSRSENQLRRCIDTFDAELPALGKNADFTIVREKFSMPDRFFYLPINEIREFVAETLGELSFTGKDLLLKELATTVGFSNVGYGSWNKKKSVIDKVLVQYNSNEVNNVVKNHIDATPIRSSMLSLATENPMAFYWSNTIKIQHVLGYLERSRAEEPQVEKFWSTLESITGKNSREVFSLLGEEVSLVLEPGPKDTFFSFPLGMVFLQVKNVPECKRILEKIIEEYHIPVSEKSYGEIQYSFWTLSPQDGLQPLYGFWDNLLFFGNSSALLGMIVKRNFEDFTLLDNMNIKTIDPGFSEKNNSVTYLDNVELIKVVQKGLSLVAMTMAIEDKEMAHKVRILIDEIINPLLDGARMYSKSCSRSYFTPEMVIIDSITTKATGTIQKRIN